MRRRTLIAGSGTVAAVGLAGCLGSAREDQRSSSSEGSERSITVREHGEAAAEPDLAVLRVGVEATGESADEVRDELAERGDELYDALVASGIDEDDVTTGQFTIRERVDDRRAGVDDVDPESEDDLETDRYYEGTHALTVEVRDVEAAGDVVDTAVDAGADDVGRIEFTLSDERREALRETALEEALAAARSEAAFVAERIDASVVEATRVDTSGGDVDPVREEVALEEAADDAEPATELHPDDVTVGATVDVEFEIR